MIDNTKFPRDLRFGNTYATILDLAKAAPLAHILLATVFFLFFRNFPNIYSLHLWYYALIIAGLFRGAFHLPVLKNQTENKGLYFYYSVVVVLQSLLWGMSAVYLIDKVPPHYSVMLILMLGGITSAGMAMLHPSIPLYFAFSLGLLIPVSVKLYFDGDQFSLELVMLMGVFWLMNMVMCLGNHKNYRKYRHVSQSLTIERRYIQDIHNAARDIAFIKIRLNKNHEIVSYSPGAQILFEFAAEKAINISFKDIQSRDSYARWAKLLNDVGKNGIPVKSEMKLGKADGSENYILFSIYPIHSEDDKDPEALIVAADITEHIKAEQALRASESKVRNIIESSPMGIHIFRLNDKKELIFVDANKTADAVLKIDNKRRIGKTITDAFPDLADTDLPAIYRKVASDGISWRSQKINYDKDNNIKTAYDLYAFQSSPGYAIVMFLDVTDRKIADAELRESRQKLALHLEQTPLGVIEWDLDFKVSAWNPAAEEIFGYTKEEAKGRHAAGLIVAENTREYVNKVWQDLISLKGGTRSTNENLTKDGRTITCEWYNTPLIDRDGKVFGVASLIHDITKRVEADKKAKELGEQLARAERMESIGVLAGGVAHDLNNILGPLVAYPELIKMSLSNDSPIVPHLNKIENSAKRAADVVSDLLTMARRGRYEMAPIDFNKVIESYLQSPELLGLKSKSPDVKIITMLNKNNPHINGSSSHLSKVIMNLIINAYEAMSGLGSITIKSDNLYLEKPPIPCEDFQPGDYIVVSFKDSGPGIENADLKRLFEPFFSKKRMGTSGSGLGLSIVYGVIQDHNGVIDVRSQKGEGAEFIIYLPTTSSSEENKDCSKQTYDGCESILIVDDIEEQCELGTTLLTSMGYDVDTASNGYKAVEMFKKKQYDILLIDMLLEDSIDGLDTYKEIIKIKPGQKAIIASGFSETDRVREAERLGVARYIRKPYTIDKLGQAVREALDSPQRVADKMPVPIR